MVALPRPGGHGTGDSAVALPHLFGKDRVIGIDIGSSSIKIMELEAAPGGGWQAARAVLQPTPPESCHDGMITDVTAVAAAVRNALRGAEIHARGAVAAVSGSQVLVRHVQVPRMSEAVLRKSIRFEAAKYISTGIDDSLVEFEIVDTEGDGGQMQIMLVAAPADLVESRVAVLEEVGLEPLVVDVEAFALMRSLVEFSTDPALQGESVALVDMGAGHTDLNIVSGGRFALTRSIPIAGASLTQAIKSQTGTSDEESESLKRRVRIGPMMDSGDAPPDESIIRTARALQPQLDELLREIRRSLHYYQSQFPEGTPQAVVSRLLLTGGTSRLAGLPEYISAKLNLRASLFNIFTEGIIGRGCLTEEEARAEGPLFAVAAGLALKSEQPARLAQAA